MPVALEKAQAQKEHDVWHAQTCLGVILTLDDAGESNRQDK